MKIDHIPLPADPEFLTDRLTGRLADRRAPRQRLQLVPFTDELVAAFFDATDGETVPTSRLAAWSGDEALCLPLLGSRLLRSDGGLRYVFFLARSARELCRKGLWISQGDRPLAEIDPFALQSPVVDAFALIVGLAPEGERRLLRALLTTGQSLFGAGAYLGIRDLVLQLLERLAPPPLALRAWCPLGATAAIASYTLPRGHEAEDIGTLVSIADASARVLSGVEADFETLGDDRLLHLFLPRGLAPDTTLVALSDTPLRLAGPAPAQRQRPLGPWLARRTSPVRRRVRDRLNRLAASDDTAAWLVAEVTCPPSATPRVSPQLVSCTGSGIFHVAGLHDPRGLLGNLVLRTGQGDILLPLARPLHHPALGPVAVGFAPASCDCGPGESAELFALYRSGRMSRVGPVTLEVFPETVPALLEDLPETEVAPPFAAALADALRERPAVRAEVIEVAASPVSPPEVTLVVELGASLDYPYALGATLAGRSEARLLLHHRDRRALAALRAVAQELHAIYGIGVALVDIAQDDVLASERMRALAGCAATDAVICLSGDVLPRERSWLEPWLVHLSRAEPVLVAAPVAGHDGGAVFPGPCPPGLDPGPDLGLRPGLDPGLDLGLRPGPDAGHGTPCFGLNGAARAVLADMPLRVPGREADIAGLGAALRCVPGARVATDPLLRMRAHARAPQRSAVLTLAESLTLAECQTVAEPSTLAEGLTLEGTAAA